MVECFSCGNQIITSEQWKKGEKGIISQEIEFHGVILCHICIDKPPWSIIRAPAEAQH